MDAVKLDPPGVKIIRDEAELERVLKIVADNLDATRRAHLWTKTGCLVSGAKN